VDNPMRMDTQGFAIFGFGRLGTTIDRSDKAGKAPTFSEGVVSSRARGYNRTHRYKSSCDEPKNQPFDLSAQER
jgi:hypothetical protein